ncbi:MAG: hypothetical protein ACYCSS_05510 [Sulfuriferula sp.]
MTNKIIAGILFAAVVLFAGCANNTPIKQPNGVYLSGAALAALDQAKIDVGHARQQHALWTTALSELKTAESAATQGDSSAVISHAHQASILAKLGIAQLSLPSTEPFK